MDDGQLGRIATEEIWKLGVDNAVYVERDSSEFVSAALTRFAELMAEHAGGFLGDMIAGAEMGAQQLNVEPYHGVLEVLQNADDAGASTLRVCVMDGASGQVLLLAHDGSPLTLREALAMTVAFVSTKRDDVLQKGKFGIGLKTLHRLGQRVEVHCRNYHFVVSQGQVELVTPVDSVRGVYDSASDTVFIVRLSEPLDRADLSDWMTHLGCSVLLFLDSVRELTLWDAEGERIAGRHGIRVVSQGRVSGASLEEGGELEVVEIAERFVRKPRRWMRYSARVEVPTDGREVLSRLFKATAPDTVVSIAVPSTSQRGSVYAGLPTRHEFALPYSVSAQFDPDTSRDGLLQSDWNAWLLESIGQLAAQVVEHRLQTDPRGAWTAVGLLEEVPDPSEAGEWLSTLLKGVVRRQQSAAADTVVYVDGDESCLKDMAYEVGELDGLLNEPDETRLRPDELALPFAMRDPQGRWRRVMDEIGESTPITVDDSLEVLSWDEGDRSARSAAWHVRFAAMAVRAGLAAQCFRERALVLSDGSMVPAFDRAAAAQYVAGIHGALAERGRLVTLEPSAGLGCSLGVVATLDPAYSAGSSDASQVRHALQSFGALVDRVSADETIRALASWSSEPLRLTDSDVIELRDCFEELQSDDVEELGRQVGRNVFVAGRCFVDGREKPFVGRPAQAYLPPSMDNDNGWSKAAGMTSGIFWVHPRYQKILKSPPDSSYRAGQAFMRLLGVELSPRLARPERTTYSYSRTAYDVSYAESNAFQIEEVRQIAGAGHPRPTHLLDDWESPDLDLVAQDIADSRVGQDRTARAKALLDTLKRAWPRTLEARAKSPAVHGYYSWNTVGTVTATWLSVLGSIPWLTNKARQKRAPRELHIDTPSNRAVHGDDPGLWASEVLGADAREPAMLALGLAGDPSAQTLLTTLTGWAKAADAGKAVGWASVQSIYVALADCCAQQRIDPQMVDGVAVSELRRRFTHDRLVWTPAGFRAPRDVRLGLPIFGADIPTVPERPELAALWRTLGIDPPSAQDCIEWLRSFARGDAHAIAARRDDGRRRLADVLRQLSGAIGDLPRTKLRPLRELPLLCSDGWRRDRPLYAIDDESLRASLSGQGLPLWEPPCSLDSLEALLEPCAVQKIRRSDFALEGLDGTAIRDGDGSLPCFNAAVAFLQAELANTDEELYRALDSWSALGSAQLAIGDHLRLTATIGRQRVDAPCDAYFEPDSFMFVFANEDSIGDPQLGGRLIASLFGLDGRDARLITLAWYQAWTKARRGEEPERFALTEGDPEWDVEAVVTPPPGEKPKTRERSGRKKTGDESAPAKPRELKDFDVVKVVMQPDSATDDGSAPQAPVTVPPRPKLKNKPKGAGGRRDDDSPAKGSRVAYGDAEREALGMRILAEMIRAEFGSEIEDCRGIAGHGADARDSAGRYIELKAHGGDPPDREMLTPHEFERAWQERSNYYLAVIGGLEKGYQTTYRLVRDPIGKLQLRAQREMVVGGIQAVQATILEAVEGAGEPKLDRADGR